MAPNNSHLAKWFDLTRPIPQEDVNEVLAGIKLLAFKDGLDIDGAVVRSQLQAFANAVRAHNAWFNGSGGAHGN